MSKRNLLYLLINSFNPHIECVLAFLTGVKPFVYVVFRTFSLSEWKLEIVLFQGVNDKACHAVFDTASQEQAILPLSKGEDSFLGEGSSCRVASAMLNLFQHLANMKEELPAKKIFTPKHLVSLACNLFTNKILNQVQDDITKNPRKNFPFFNTSEEGGDKNLQFQAWHLNSNMKGGDKKCLA